MITSGDSLRGSSADYCMSEMTKCRADSSNYTVASG